jgi:hypothetical protein
MFDVDFHVCQNWYANKGKLILLIILSINVFAIITTWSIAIIPAANCLIFWLIVLGASRFCKKQKY